MRLLLVLLVSILPTSIAYCETFDERKIKNLLTSKQTWTMYLEYTDRSTPSDQANKFVWKYFERDGKLFTRRRGLAFGGCDSELLIRADGFSFPMV